MTNVQPADTTLGSLDQRVLAWACEMSGRATLADNSTLADLGIDSLAVLTLVARIVQEEDLDAVRVGARLAQTRGLGTLRTVGDLVQASRRLTEVGAQR